MDYADDFAFSINEETEEGFVSSNRVADGKGMSDDIYSIKKLDSQSVMYS